MEFIKNKKIRTIAGLSVCVLIICLTVILLISLIEEKNLHPNITKPGTDISLKNISLSEDLKQNFQEKDFVYKNAVNLSTSLDIVSNCLQYDLKNSTYEELPGDVNIRKYILPQGICYVEEDTGYWNYSVSSNNMLNGVAESEFVSDKEITEKTKDFIAAHNLFGKNTYDISVTEMTTGGWNSEEKVVRKEATVFPDINGVKVYGVYRMVLSYDSDGNIVEISNCYNPSSKLEKVELKSFGKIKTMLDTEDYSASASSSMESVQITSARLAYYADSSPNEDGNFYIYPIYIFEAEGVNMEGKLESFDIFVDAVK